MVNPYSANISGRFWTFGPSSRRSTDIYNTMVWFRIHSTITSTFIDQ